MDNHGLQSLSQCHVMSHLSLCIYLFYLEELISDLYETFTMKSPTDGDNFVLIKGVVMMKYRMVGDL